MHKCAGGVALTIYNKLEEILPRDFDWRGKDFEGVDLEGADISGLDFTGCSFKNANIANTNLENTVIEYCDFTGARIEQTGPILSVLCDLFGEHIYAFYKDGIVRKWGNILGKKPVFKVVGNHSASSDCVFGLDHEQSIYIMDDDYMSVNFLGDN